MNKPTNQVWLMLTLFTLLLCVGCTKTSKTEDEPSGRYSDYLLVGETDMKHHDYSIKLYAEIDPHVGYNNFAVKVLQKGTSNPVEGAQVVYWPNFKTATATYSSYVEQSFDPQYKYMHHGGVVFTSPADSTQSWHLAVLVREPGQNITDTAIFDLNLKQPAHARVFEFVHEENPQVFKTYYVTLIKPIRPKLQYNLTEFLVFKRESNASVVAINNLRIRIDATSKVNSDRYMGYTDPATIPIGHYKSSLNFESSGEWRLKLTITDEKNKVLWNQGYFDLTVKEK